MSNVMRAVALSIVLFGTAGLSEASGQEVPARRRPDISVETTVKRLRAGTFGSRTGEILSQKLGPLPRAELDALADSMVAIILEYRPGEPYEKQDFAIRLMVGLMTSANGKSGTTYPGAFDRLVRIFENSEDGGIRNAALGGISEMSDTARALAYLSKVATAGLEEDGHLVTSAVNKLSHAMGPKGVELLHQLYKAGRITHPAAKNSLWQIRQYYGWD